MERKVSPEEQGGDGERRDTSIDTSIDTAQKDVDDKRLEVGKNVETRIDVAEAEATVDDGGFDSTTTSSTARRDHSSSSSSSSSDAIATSSSSSGAGEQIGSLEVVVVPVHGGVAGGDQSGRIGQDNGVLRCPSSFSTDSFADCCRICQHHGEEPLIELGCHCRGELSRAHRSCVEQWFGNKGSNKCEICQHVAENIPAPIVQATPHFWVWRLGINRGSRNFTQRSGGGRFHPLWAALLILIAGLLFDVLISIFLGASALPVNIIIGVLVVLGIGTAARLVIECWHERGLRRNIRRIETNLASLHGHGEAHGSALQVQSDLLVQSSVRPIP